MLLGCIGDDFTGSSDLGNTLTKEGMRVVQYVGVPTRPAEAGVEAGVVALKSRSIPVAEAVAQSLAALEWLKAQGCTQFLFKYCSTFDSTDEGNIGPVAEALAAALAAEKVICCPAFPATGRRVFMGHLFVGDRLLSECGMQNHPLTPMTDPDLRRVLAAQCQGSVGHVSFADVALGFESVTAALEREAQAGHRLVIADAVTDQDLRVLGAAAAELPLLTGGSGIALGLAENFREKGQLAGSDGAWRGQSGPCVALSGSCSIATRAQVEAHRAARHPCREVTVQDVLSGAVNAVDLADWAMGSDGVPLIYSSAEPDVVAAAQAAHGRARVAAALEGLFAQIAQALVMRGVARLIVAGGETSGAVVEALAPEALAIGPEIDPGVPVVRAADQLVLALKSGNFGAVDFFEKASGVMEGRV